MGNIEKIKKKTNLVESNRDSLKNNLDTSLMSR